MFLSPFFLHLLLCSRAASHWQVSNPPAPDSNTSDCLRVPDQCTTSRKMHWWQTHTVADGTITVTVTYASTTDTAQNASMTGPLRTENRAGSSIPSAVVVEIMLMLDGTMSIDSPFTDENGSAVVCCVICGCACLWVRHRPWGRKDRQTTIAAFERG